MGYHLEPPSLWTYFLSPFTEIIQLLEITGAHKEWDEYISQRGIIRLAYRIQSGESNRGHLHTEEAENSVDKAR